MENKDLISAAVITFGNKRVKCRTVSGSEHSGILKKYQGGWITLKAREDDLDYPVKLIRLQHVESLELTS